ncbi:MAG TPA: hemolysin family protein [Polyangiales bacterium]|nr:hemolysin family protein [Polyangiales bacterium]
MCVLANAFFVAAEFAMARVRPTALEARARSGDLAAERAFKITKQLDAYLTATQLGITLASLALGWLGEPALVQLLNKPLSALGLSENAVHGTAVALGFGTLSLLHIVVGELVPKSLAILRPETVARMTALPMVAFYWAMYPLLMILNNLSIALLKRTGVSELPPEGPSKLSEQELRLIIQLSFAEDNQRMKRELLDRVLRSTDRPVRALMVPRVDMYMLSLMHTHEQWLDQIRKSGFSRYPVSEDGDPDHIIGYVYVKDMLLTRALPKGGLRALKRDVLFVPESCTVGELLSQIQRTRIPLAIVVDEYGGTSGLVTLEDVVEELVGDIQDEFDAESPTIQTREDGTILVDGTVPLGDLPIDGLDENVRLAGDTVGGYIIGRLGRLAHPGDRVRIGSYEATVEDMRRRRIGRVALRSPSPSSIPPPEET